MESAPGFLQYLLEVGDLFSPISPNSQSQHWWYCILCMRWQHHLAVQRIRRLTCAHFLKVMFLCVQLGSQIRHFHSLNLRLLALSPHYMLSEVLFQTKMTVLRNSAIHVSTKTVPYFHTTFHYFPVDRRLGYHSRGRGGSKGPWKWGPVAPPDDKWRGRIVQSLSPKLG